MTYRALILFFLASLLLHGEAYRLGEGIQLGKSPFYLGGYFSLEYADNLQNVKVASLDDTALMLYGSLNAWSFMSEMEINEMYQQQWGDTQSSSSNYTVHAERVYARYAPSDTLAIQGGKFNTPVGIWNLMPINVLRDTTSDPLVVETIFPRFTTGVEVDVSSTNQSNFTLLIQGTQDLDALLNPNEIYNNIDVNQHFGLGYVSQVDALKIGIHGGYFQEDITDDAFYYGYVAMSYMRQGWKILSEGGYRKSQQKSLYALGGYVQLVRKFSQRHQGILRAESLYDDFLQSNDTLGVVAYTYRPLFPVALKSEFQLHTKNDERKFLISLSVLF